MWLSVAPPLIDWFDGKVARMTTCTQFGKDLDLITDVSCGTVVNGIVWYWNGVGSLRVNMLLWLCSACRHVYLMNNDYKRTVTLFQRDYTVNVGVSNTFIPFIVLYLWRSQYSHSTIEFVLALLGAGMASPLLFGFDAKKIKL